MRVVNLFGGPGTGKAQPLTSNILTPNGWVMMKDVFVGMDILTPSGDVAQITSIHPQGPKEIYNITFHDGSSTKACADHLWSCWSVNTFHKKKSNTYNKKAELTVLTTNQINERIRRNSRGQFKFNVSIPLITPNLPTNNVPEFSIPPYIMGVLLGDGSFCTGGITFTSTDEHIVNKTTSLLSEGFRCNKYGTSSTFGITSSKTNNEYLDSIRSFGLFNKKSDEKFIPNDYINGSNSQRLELIQGLFDTDGTVDTRGGCSFSTTSETMAKQVQNILWSFGCTASIKTRTPFYKKDGVKRFGKKAYTVYFNAPDKTLFFTLPRKINRIKTTNPNSLRRRVTSITTDSISEAQCITINHPDHLYITDDYIVTHNSTVAAGLYYHMKIQHEKVELVTEFAKDLVYARQLNSMMDQQEYIFAEQNWRVQRLLNHDVDWVITDSPLLLSTIYPIMNQEQHGVPFWPALPQFIEFVVAQFNCYDNINIYLNRTVPFQQYGRERNEQQAREIDAAVFTALRQHAPKFTIVDVDNDTVSSILEIIHGN